MTKQYYQLLINVLKSVFKQNWKSFENFMWQIPICYLCLWSQWVLLVDQILKKFFLSIFLDFQFWSFLLFQWYLSKCLLLQSSVRLSSCNGVRDMFLVFQLLDAADDSGYDEDEKQHHHHDGHHLRRRKYSVWICASKI